MLRIEKKHLDRKQLALLANWMVDHLPDQLTIGITGTLGAGKTTLVQFIAKAAGINTESVTSPTFTLLQTHHGKIKLHHMDAYRVQDEDEFLELGVEELFEDHAWTLIEWADRVEAVMPQDTLWIKIDLTEDQNLRHLSFTNTGSDLDSILAKFESQAF